MLPDRFKDAIDGSSYSNECSKLFDDFEDIVKKSEEYFFPDYTDHSGNHCSQVLHFSNFLIDDESWAVLNDDDITILSLSCLFHDIGHHIQRDSFFKIVNDDWIQEDQLLLNDRRWGDLWNEYLQKVHRWSAGKLKRITDSTEEITIPDETSKFTPRHIRVIGEFLRRHHPRLAHEIAMYGFPGRDVEDEVSIKEMSEDIRFLFGFIARSHGLGLREAIDILDRDTPIDKDRYKGVHPVYLMCLIRVADSLHITPERAPEDEYSIKNIDSPFSDDEWVVHHTVENVDYLADSDPLALYIRVDEPEDIKIYFKLVDRIEDIQSELDIVWAVIGEIYSLRRDELSELGLKIKRVNSNIHREEFKRRLSFIPCKATFDTSGPELIDMLVGPLYENELRMGLRELVQNSVDAVRERLDFTEQNMDEITLQEDCHIHIYLEQKENEVWLVVKDSGIGMTLDILRDYFLTAGSSFREHPKWKYAFEESTGKSKVLRSGRFGIGVFSAFLLGDRIDVTTKHISKGEDDEGIHFIGSLHDELLKLEPEPRDVGTTVKVRLNQKAYKNYFWVIGAEMYKLRLPILRVNYENLYDQDIFSTIEEYYGDATDDGHIEEDLVGRLIGSEALPYQDDPLGPYWHRIETEIYQELHWSYEQPNRMLFCNGILIEDGLRDLNFGISNYFEVEPPEISVFDPDAHLPLNLQRTGLIETPSFNEKLKEDLIDHFIAFWLLALPNTYLNVLRWLKSTNHPAFSELSFLKTPLLIGNDWVCPANRKCIIENDIEVLVFCTWDLFERLYAEGDEFDPRFGFIVLDKISDVNKLPFGISREDSISQLEPSVDIVGTALLRTLNPGESASTDNEELIKKIVHDYWKLEVQGEAREELLNIIRGTWENLDWRLFDPTDVATANERHLGAKVQYINFKEDAQFHRDPFSDRWFDIFEDGKMPISSSRRDAILEGPLESLEEKVEKLKSCLEPVHDEGAKYDVDYIYEV